MDERVPVRSFRTMSRKKEGTVTMEAGPSVQKMSKELERLFAPPTIESEVEEKKETDFIPETQSPNHLLYKSPERNIVPSPVITPTRQDSNSEKKEKEPKNTSTKENFDHDNEENNGRSTFARCLQPGLNQEVANAMARHVVTKLRKEAAAMMAAATEKKKDNNSQPFHRRASPIARMRDGSLNRETMMFDDEPPKKEYKSDGEEKEQRRKQWKKKAKIAQRKQRRARKLRDEYTVGTDSQYSTNNPIIGCVLDNVESTDLFKRLSQCSGGVYNRDACAQSEFDDLDYGSSSSMESDEDDITEDYTTEDDFGARSRRRQRDRRQGKKKWESHSLDSSSVDTTLPEELTASYLVSDDGSDHHDDGGRNLSRSELNQSLENRSLENRSDLAFAGYSSVYSGRASTTSGSKTSRINHTTMSRLLMNKIDSPGFEKSFLQDMESKGESMLWHQDTSSIDPSPVLMRLKKGNRLPNGRYCSPRLIWTDLRKKQNHGFEIFDIRSLDPASMLHLKEFPYAIPGRSVLLHLNNSQTFIFEAGTEMDMARFVQGMRLLISRLTRSLVTGNLDESCDFLDMGLWGDHRKKRQVRKSDVDWTRAMDDVTEAMIENALVSMTFEV
eukprot:CAMPEP_0116134444 /NCGR_PEP_ID=MMETSP0329-20121206/10648_1 /TAXON_ID=697910 /ORGANISM="Pseudo-nitzschia arenysensis, Strain B593" /LENGTH=613 /DNA_ID=CAMNT_0003629153 /DNA_START=59 /DNA_END=1900 /DNA_ORIENTATION=+